MLVAFSALLALAGPMLAPDEHQSFASAKYGVEVELPPTWEVAIREEEDVVFACVVPQRDPNRPGAVGCEIALAPESLDEFRTRISRNHELGRARGTLVKNELVSGPGGDRLETMIERKPPFGGTWIEYSVRMIVERQMYVFTMTVSVEEPDHASVRQSFRRIIDSAKYSPPDTGAVPVEGRPGRWSQREFKFAMDLPQGWSPALAPSQVALFFANGPARGIWADNVLVVARPHADLDLESLAKSLPDELRAAEPACDVLSCELVPQGASQALETTVRVRRGPFSMTVLERRFRGHRFDYEVKFTVESDRFDQTLPDMRKCLDSFAESPGDVPSTGARPG